MAAADDLADRLPDGRRHTLPGAGRRGVLEAPAELAVAVDEFCATLGGQR